MKDISCIIGITLLIGSLSMSLQKRNTNIFNKFIDNYKPSAECPFGDGKATEKILQVL